MNTTFFTLAAIVFYLLATSQLCLVSSRWAVLRKFCGKAPFLIAGSLAATLHAYVLYQDILTPTGLNLGFFNALSLVAWVIALMLLFAIINRPVENLAMILLPLAAICVGLGDALPSAQLVSANTSMGFKLHLFTSLIAYSILSLAALQAVFLWFQDYHLRHKHPGKVMKFLPPLQIMEDLLIQSVGLGFIFLSAGLISGALFLDNMFKQHVAHHTVLAIIAWLVFATLLWGRWRYGWRGRAIIRHTLLGFFILMLAYFGSKFVYEWILQRSA
jgi:ABC-type uncharacterized transport system permease subunit